jgi:hypothetical protein
MLARVAMRQGGCTGRHFLNESIRDAVLNDHTLCRHADLAVIGIGSKDRGVHSSIEVRVV